MVRNTLLEIYEMVKTPFRSIKEGLLKMKKAFNDVIDTLKTFVMKIKRIILNIREFKNLVRFIFLNKNMMQFSFLTIVYFQSM